MKNSSIGVFDSGLGGLTVASEIAHALPQESLIYLGDTSRCPYGPRDFGEVRQFVFETCSWLSEQNVKLIVIACNTGTAAGLSYVQQEFDIPIIGVVDPGARAAVRVTRNRHIGVIGTVGTISSNVYPEAIHALDAGIKTTSVATPDYVDIIESELGDSDFIPGSGILVRSEHRKTAASYLKGFDESNIDTLILGCTHYPLLSGFIGSVMGDGVKLISSAEETASEVAATLQRRGHLAYNDCDSNDTDGNISCEDSLRKLAGSEHPKPNHKFYTTGDVDRFTQLGSRAFGKSLSSVKHLPVAQLQIAAQRRLERHTRD